MEFEPQIFYSPDATGGGGVSGQTPIQANAPEDFFSWAETASAEDVFVNWLRQPSYTVRTNIAEKFSENTWSKMTQKAMEDETWAGQPTWKKALADYVYYIPLNTPLTAKFIIKAFYDKDAASEIAKTRLASISLDDKFTDKSFEPEALRFLTRQSDKVKWRRNDDPATLADRWMTMQLINIPEHKLSRTMIENHYGSKHDHFVQEWSQFVKRTSTDNNALAKWWEVMTEIVKTDDPFYISRAIIPDINKAVGGQKHQLTMGSIVAFPATIRIISSSNPDKKVEAAFRETMSEIFTHDVFGHDNIITPAIQACYKKGEEKAAVYLFDVMHSSRGISPPANRDEMSRCLASAGHKAQIIWIYYPPFSPQMCYMIIDDRADHPDTIGAKSSVTVARYKEKETGYDLPGASVTDINSRRSADALGIALDLKLANKDYYQAEAEIENNPLTEYSPENIRAIDNYITALEWTVTHNYGYPGDARKFTDKILGELRSWLPEHPQVLAQYVALAHAAPFYSLEENQSEYFLTILNNLNTSLLFPITQDDVPAERKPLSISDFAAEVQRLTRVHLASFNLERIKSFAHAYLEKLDKQMDDIRVNPEILGSPETFLALITTVAPLNTQNGWRNFENPDDVFSRQFHAVRKKALDILVESEHAVNGRTGYPNILQSLISEWPSLSQKNQETIINVGLLNPNGIFRYHWTQMIGGMNQSEIFPFIRETLIPWALRQKEAELLLGGIFQGKFSAPPGLPMDIPSALPLSQEIISRGIVESIISVWLTLDGPIKNMVIAQIFDADGALHNHFAGFARNLEFNYDYLIHTLLPLMQRDEDAGSMLHFILANSPHLPEATADQITAKEMVIEAAMFTTDKPTYPNLANFHEFVNQLNASDRYIGMSGNIPVIIMHTNPDSFPSHFPVAFDAQHGEIKYWGELVEGNGDSTHYPPYNRIHRSILRGLEQHPAAEPWLSAIDAEKELKLAESIKNALAKKLISPPRPKTPIRLPLFDTSDTIARESTFPRINLFETNENRATGDIGLGGAVHFTPENRISFYYTTTGIRFTDVPAIPRNFTSGWHTDLDMVRKAVLQKTADEFLSGERERKHLNQALRRMTHKKHIVGSRSRDNKPIRDYSRPGDADFDGMMRRLEEHYGFMANTDQWITKNMGIFITRGQWKNWKDAICEDVLKDGMTDELEWVDKQMKTLDVNEIWIGRPVNIDDPEEVSFDNRKIQTIPDEKFREIPGLLDIILNKDNWEKEPGIQFLGLSKRPLRANVIRARRMTYDAYKVVIFTRDPDTGLIYDPPRTRYATFRAPIFNDYVLKLLGWINAEDEEAVEPPI